MNAVAFTFEGLGGFVLAVLAGAAMVLIAVRGLRVHIDRKER